MAKQLEVLSEDPIWQEDPGDLPDLLHMTITGSTPEQRRESYLAQVKNPHCFRVGKTPVHIIYCGETPLSEKLRHYFLGLKTGV